MHRVDATNHYNNTFTDGNAQTGIAPTTLAADWHNSVQEEIANVVEFTGDTLDRSDNTQLLTNLIPHVGGMTALRAIAPVSGYRVYLKYHTTAGDGGHGVFRGVTGAAAATYTHDGYTTIVPSGGDGSAAWIAEHRHINSGSSNPVFDEASGVLARVLGFDNQGVTTTIAAGKQLNIIGIREDDGGNNVFSIGSGSKVSGYEFYIESAATSHSASNAYGVIGNVVNSGPGTVKAVYGRAVAEAGCTGVVMGLVAGVDTTTGINTATGMQMTFDTDSGDPMSHAIWITSNTATTTNAAIGILFDNIAITDAIIKARAHGAGDFLQLQNSAASAELFVVDSTGVIAECKGATINGNVTLGSQNIVELNNDTRSYQLQAVTSGDYFRILIEGVGTGLLLSSTYNLGVAGQNSDGGGVKVMMIPNAQTNPSTNPTGGGILYCDGGALKYRGSSGTTTTLAVA